MYLFLVDLVISYKQKRRLYQNICLPYIESMEYRELICGTLQQKHAPLTHLPLQGMGLHGLCYNLIYCLRNLNKHWVLQW